MLFKDIKKSRDYIHGRVHGSPEKRGAKAGMRQLLVAVASVTLADKSEQIASAIIFTMDALWHLDLLFEYEDNKAEHLKYGSKDVAKGDAIYYLGMIMRDIGVMGNWRGRGVEYSFVHALTAMEYMIIKFYKDVPIDVIKRVLK